MLFLSSFGIISVDIPEPIYFFLILASIVDATAVTPNGAKIFFVNGIATFIIGPAILLRNAPKKSARLSYFR